MVLRTGKCGIGRVVTTMLSWSLASKGMEDAEVESADLDRDKEHELGGRGGEGENWLLALQYAAVVSSSKLLTDTMPDKG
mmetsp:Transcript_26502/g.76501  ORF Transcript_26502/g.76501 Transcript_26502/m.76501 type:complete len:80 (-) Transcript_26502:775-1014(-)